jgi:ubiquinone/menaquinone biosynthesis C-methylase UbiE
MDPKQVVADGYDRLYRTYAAWGGGHAGWRHRYIDRAVELGVSPPATALDLGCGTGQHATGYLIERGFEVTAVDLSARSIDVARREVPDGRFIVGDMTSIVLPETSFDLIVAFYSIIHVPRVEHAQLLARVVTWLRPGGLLVAAMGGGAGLAAGHDQTWLGEAPMYWSYWEPSTSARLIEDAGLELVQDEEERVVEDGQEVAFWWVIARKPCRLPR